MVLQAIRYESNQLHILDQLQLPFVSHYTELKSAQDAWHAIKEMRVRGAPAIAIVAALALAVELHEIRSRGKLSSIPQEVSFFVEKKLGYLATSRPTAVNLADAARKLKAAVKKESEKADATGDSVALVYEIAAAKMLVDDVEDNRRIGDFGAEWILKNAILKNGERRVEVLTHCNTGSLATAGYGTALGVIRSLHAKGALNHAYCTETRPYNQGARLTAYELVYDKLPATLVTDSMAAALLARGKTDKRIAAIVVGADRVAANGDTANKIGTYGLAILAKYHGVKFLVAAPRTTIDVGTRSGKDIIIEERPKDEVTMIKGPCYTGDEVDALRVETIKVAAKGIDVWNPSFDVTPAELIDGIITEVGVVEKDSGNGFHLQDLFEMDG